MLLELPDVLLALVLSKGGYFISARAAASRYAAALSPPRFRCVLSCSG